MHMDMDGITIHTAACFTIAFLFLTTIISKIIARIRTIRLTRKGKRSPITLRPPQVVSGAPLMAALLTLVTPKKGLHAAIHELHMKMGSVFTVNLFGLKKVTLINIILQMEQILNLRVFSELQTHVHVTNFWRWHFSLGQRSLLISSRDRHPRSTSGIQLRSLCPSSVQEFCLVWTWLPGMSRSDFVPRRYSRRGFEEMFIPWFA